MKIIGILIIICCVIFNAFVGLTFLGKSLTEAQLYVSNESKLISYDQYGVRMEIPKNMESLGSKVELNILEVFIHDDIAKQFDPVLQVNVYGQMQENANVTSEEYKKDSEAHFKRTMDPSLQFQYQDGGIYTNKNGVKLYYDVASLLHEDQLLTQKIVTFFHNGNQIQIIWADEPVQFVTSVSTFDAIADTVRMY
jgi:hypothetical protein